MIERSAPLCADRNAAVGTAPNKASGASPSDLHATQAPSGRVQEKPAAANSQISADARAPAVSPASSVAAVTKQAQAPVSQATPAANNVRLGKTEVPKDIPNLGGRRPKQSQAVRSDWILLSISAQDAAYF